MGFDKFLVNFAEFFFGITIAEAIIIVFLIILYNKKKNEITKLIGQLSKKTEDAKKWHDESVNKNLELGGLKNENQKMCQELNEKEILLKDLKAKFVQTNDEQNETSKAARDNNAHFSGGWEALLSKEGRTKVLQKENDDGTIRNEVLFDSPQGEAGANSISNTLDTQEFENKPVLAPISRKYDYLKGLNSGKFLKIIPSPEKSFFRTWVENETRKFEFCGDVEKALANFNAIFDNVCEIVEGKQNGATQIINDEPGTLDSNLKVETPAKIKLA